MLLLTTGLSEKESQSDFFIKSRIDGFFIFKMACLFGVITGPSVLIWGWSAEK